MKNGNIEKKRGQKLFEGAVWLKDNPRTTARKKEIEVAAVEQANDGVMG